MSEQLIAPHALRYTWLEPKETRWTEACLAKLRAAWTDPSIPRKDLAAHVGRTEQACDRMARLLGLGRRPAQRALKSHEWSAEEVAVLRAHWPNIGTIYARLGRTIGAIEKQARKQGLPPKTGAFKGPLPNITRDAKAESRLVIRHPQGPVITRKCLCCGTQFGAPTRFLRMCERCRREA